MCGVTSSAWSDRLTKVLLQLALCVCIGGFNGWPSAPPTFLCVIVSPMDGRMLYLLCVMVSLMGGRSLYLLCVMVSVMGGRLLLPSLCNGVSNGW